MRRARTRTNGDRRTGHKRSAFGLAVALLVGAALAPQAYAGYNVTLSGNDLTAVATAHDTATNSSDNLVQVDERTPYADLPAGDTRRWVFWPVTGVDSTLLDSNPTSENCRYFNHNFGPGGDDGGKCLLISSLTVTGGGSATGDRVAAYTGYDVDRALAVTANLAGGPDSVSLGDHLLGPHSLTAGTGRDYLELPRGYDWNVNLQSNAVSGGLPMTISGFEDLRIDGFFGESDTVVVTGTGGANELFTDAMRSTISGAGGADVIDAGAGTNTASGGAGDDEIEVGFFSEPGQVQDVEGNDGNDEMTIWGEDLATGHGGAGNDDVFGFSDGVNTLTGGDGDDFLWISPIDPVPGSADGGAGTDLIWGAAGADTLHAGTGTSDDVFGFGGPDQIDADPAATGTLLIGDHNEPTSNPGELPGADTIRGSDGPDTINGGGQADHLFGNGGADSIRGDNVNAQNPWDPPGGDEIDAGAGDDVVFGRAGDDTITGGPGNDMINCGPGDDEVTDPEPGDTLIECEDLALEVRISSVETEAAGDVFPITLTLQNKSTGEALKNIIPVNEFGFGVVAPPTGPGEIQVVSGPQPPFPATLEPGQSSEHTITVQATKTGRVWLKAGVTATGAGSDKPVEDTNYGEVVIGETPPTDVERTAMTATGVALFLNNLARTVREQQARYANQIWQALQSRLSAKAKRFWFGSENKLKITDYERAMAGQRGVAPEWMAIETPNKPKLFEDGRVYLNAEQQARLHKLEDAATLKLVAQYMGDTVDSVKKGIAFEAAYWSQLASEEGQGRLAADYARFYDLNRESGDYLLAAIGNSLSYEGTRSALDESDAAVRAGLEASLTNLVADRDARIDKLARLAETDPDAFIEQLANDGATVRFAGVKLGSETLMGEAEFALAGKVYSGGQAALARFTKAIGVETKTGAKTLAKTTLIAERSATVGPSYLDDLSEEAKSFISLRKMDDIGGMPKGDVAITQDIVAKTNQRLNEQGYPGEIEALFRPANPFKVTGSFAKVEAVGVNNVAPIDLAIGAPPKTLGETAIFEPINPKTLPGYAKYPEAEKTLLTQRYEDRLSIYKQFDGQIPVTDKKLKEMLKSFDDVHTFDNLGQGRTIKMKLSKDKVDGATVLKYDYLEVQGKKLIDGGPPRPIGTDYDQAALIDKNTRELLKGQRLSAAEAEMRRLGEDAAIESGYANPFHGATASGSDVAAADYPFIAHYWLRHLKEADALREAERLAAAYNLGKPVEQHITAAQILKKAGGLFDRHLLRINASEASFGPSDVVFTTPVVVPK